MLLTLLMPSIDRVISGGVVTKWLKAEGDEVEYGDDLVEIRVELKLMRSLKSFPEKIKLLAGGRTLDARDLEIVQDDAPGASYSVCLTSSDMGFLRRIDAPEGTYREVGGPLALLSTGRDEPIDEASATSGFRVVVNMVQEE